MIRSLGVEVTLCCALGGETGRVLRSLITAEGVGLAAVDVNSPNGAYVHDRRSGSRVEVAYSPGHALTRHERDDLYGMTVGHGLASGLCLLSGVAEPHIVPPAMYRRLTGDLRRNERPVMADLCGEYLDAALASGLDLVKISDDEVLNDGRAPDRSRDALLSAMEKIKSRGARTVIVTRADRPALLWAEGEDPLEVVVPRLEPVDPIGAGDSLTAALAAVIATGGDLTTAVRTGAAAGALNVARHGLGTGDADAIARLASMVRICPWRTHPEADTILGERRMSVSEFAHGDDR